LDRCAEELSYGIIYRSNGFDVYENLAIENYLLHTCETVCLPILYLWQNKSAVVIGRNQNAYAECNIEYAKENGIQIARRTTGGGAVYHDLGNINFTIILPRDKHNPDCSTDIIIRALKKLNLKAEKTGRNDICIDGKKISGNAYYSNERVGLHHGTVLYQKNVSTIEKVLTVSESKLSKYGISSVKARIGDIVSIQNGIGIEDVMDVIKASFVEKYGISTARSICINKDDLEKDLSKFRSEDWNINKISEYEQFVERNFSWGNVRISFLFDGIKLERIEISSDTLYVEQIDNIKKMVNEAIANDDKISGELQTILNKSYKQEMVTDVISIIKEVYQ